MRHGTAPGHFVSGRDLLAGRPADASGNRIAANIAKLPELLKR
jgi:hypothetical protein